MTDVVAHRAAGADASGRATTAEPAVAVRFDAVSRSYRTKKGVVTALEDVSLAIPRGSVFGIIGHSGAGKSTLVRMINGLDSPTSGRVLLEGEDLAGLSTARVRAAQKNTGMVFQQFHLLETVTVQDNVAMPLRLDGVSKKEARARVAEALDFVGLADKATRYPNELSGGQKQRVGVARAIARNPPVLLCDEATSALDPSTTQQIIDLLARINREYGTTIVVVTHEMDVIKDLCRDVAVMADGRVVETGSVLDVFVDPQSDVARAFVGTVVPNTVPRRVLDLVGTADIWRLRLIDEQVVQPLVSTLIAECGVAVNILHADMTEIQEHTVGTMIIQVEGPADRVDAAREHVRARVAVLEEVAR